MEDERLAMKRPIYSFSIVDEDDITKKASFAGSLFGVELPGLEPRTTEPKSAVLPLHHSSIRCS